MADDTTLTVTATFQTRAQADLAVEHLVQQHGIARPDIFVQAVGADNTTGSRPSGGDASHQNGPRDDAPLSGEIEVSADIAERALDTVTRSLADAGAIRVTER
ncbi:hypothetical protein J2858_001448 [Neorhizobium galegae]|uniref:hypothetical protein n=1 Tax=Neorhizobium galegae TaxID=399 RepID=UPI001AE2E633|nr:hypothetical protein [Neorhizobium galegae]MBP2548555.1 hypothetical protein [Neorhizobium galegae]